MDETPIEVYHDIVELAIIVEKVYDSDTRQYRYTIKTDMEGIPLATKEGIFIAVPTLNLTTQRPMRSTLSKRSFIDLP
jgi:hypothetical protein